jgi:hypothetical protein
MTTKGKPVLTPLTPADRKRLEEACKASKRTLGRQSEFYVLQGLQRDGF